MKKRELLQALETVKPGLASREIIEQATSFAFMNGCVVTYNDEISVSRPVEGLEIEGAVEAEVLHKFLARAGADDVEVEAAGSEIRLTAGRARAGLALQAEIRLPVGEVGKVDEWHALPEGFIGAVRTCLPSCARGMSHPVLTCVHARRDGLVEATDNYRITRAEIGSEIPVDTFLMPAASARELLKFGAAEVAFGGGWMHFRTDAGTVLSCRVFEDKFPDVSKFLEVKDGTELRLPKESKEMLERAAVFTEASERDDDVEIRVGDRRMTASVRADTSWFEEDAPIQYRGDPLSFAVNPLFLRDMVEQVRVCTVGGAVIKFEGEGWVHVIALRAE